MEDQPRFFLGEKLVHRNTILQIHLHHSTNLLHETRTQKTKSEQTAMRMYNHSCRHPQTTERATQSDRDGTRRTQDGRSQQKQDCRAKNLLVSPWHPSRKRSVTKRRFTLWFRHLGPRRCVRLSVRRRETRMHRHRGQHQCAIHALTLHLVVLAPHARLTPQARTCSKPWPLRRGHRAPVPLIELLAARTWL